MIALAVSWVVSLGIGSALYDADRMCAGRLKPRWQEVTQLGPVRLTTTPRCWFANKRRAFLPRPLWPRLPPTQAGVLTGRLLLPGENDGGSFRYFDSQRDQRAALSGVLRHASPVEMSVASQASSSPGRSSSRAGVGERSQSPLPAARPFSPQQPAAAPSDFGWKPAPAEPLDPSVRTLFGRPSPAQSPAQSRAPSPARAQAPPPQPEQQPAAAIDTLHAAITEEVR